MLRILLKFNDKVLKVIDTDKDQLTIGRNLENDLQIDNLAVSSFHARVEKQLGHYFIEDLNSTNGTFVNNKKITRWGLSQNDAVTIGKHTLVFLMEKDDGQAAAAHGIRELEMDKTMVLETRQHKEVLDKMAFSGSKIGILSVLEGGTDQPEYELTSNLTLIGKDPTAGIRLEGWLAPKVAGFVTRDKNGYALSPPDSRNKLKLNGQVISDDTYLKDGDQIEVGAVRMRFHFKQ